MFAIPSDVLEKLGRYSCLGLECDGMTRIVTHLLTKAEVPHKVKCGVIFKGEERVIPFHYWVVLPDQRIIDYKARMWLGNKPEVPHGIFSPKEFPEYRYVGRTTPMSVSPFMFGILTEGAR